MGDNGIRADGTVVTDVHRSQHLGPRADGDPVPEGGVALAVLKGGSTKGDALIERDVIADDGGLADHHADAMVDKKAVTNGRRWVDVNVREHSRNCLHYSSYQAKVMIPQPVGDSVAPDSVEAGVRQDDFERGASSGI